MALDISQIVAVAFPAIVAEARKPANQWAESSFMKELDRQGAIVSRSLGPTIEAPLDYRRNQGGDFLATDLTTTSLTKTDVLTSASYTPANLTVPIIWSKADDAQAPARQQKVDFVKSLVTNALDTHDDLIEEALFATSTDGFLGLATFVPTSGQGSVGGISAVTETWWRNGTDTYAADGSDIEAVLTGLWNAAAKGSGSALAPTLLVSGSDAQALFESTQVSNQRFVDTQELKAGFKVLAFKTARYVFSQYGDTKIYGLNPKSFQLVTSKEYFRDRGETREIDNANGFVSKIFSSLQSITNNKSRLFVADQA